MAAALDKLANISRRRMYTMDYVGHSVRSPDLDTNHWRYITEIFQRVERLSLP